MFLELEIYFVIEDIVRVFLIVMLICVFWEEVFDIVFVVFITFIILFIEFVLFMVKRYFVKNCEEESLEDEVLVFSILDDIFRDFYDDFFVFGEMVLNGFFEDNFFFDV